MGIRPRVLESSFGELAFLGANHLGVIASALVTRDLGRSNQVEHALLVIDRRRPGAHLRLPAELLGPGRALRDLLAMPMPSGGVHVLLTAIEHSGRVEIYELRLTPEAAAELDARFTSASPAESEPTVLTVWPEQVVVRELIELEDLRGWALAPQGDALALVVADPDGFDSEIARLPLAGGELELLTANPIRDYQPRFSADGGAIVFASAIRLRISELSYTVPRIARLDRARVRSPDTRD